MKKSYLRLFTRLFTLCCLLTAHTLRAQTAPVVQWQKVVPAGSNPGAVANRAIIIKNGTAGYLVSSGDRRLLSLNPNGDITSDTPITGLFADGSTSPSLNVLDMVMATDANVVFAVQDNAGTSIQKRTTSGGVIWNNRLFPYSNDYGYTTTRLVANPDGSIVCFATYQDRRVLFGEQYIIAIKLNSDGTQQWSKTIKYPGATATIVERAIAGHNGQYLIVGSTYAPTDNNTFFRGWAATISGSGDVVWQRRYDDINGLNAIAPFGDSGNAYVINGPLFSKPGGMYTASSIIIDNTGNVNSSFPLGIIPDPAFNSLATLTAVPNTNRPAVYVQAFDTPTAVRGGDMQLTAFSSENKILWSKAIGGSGRDYNFGPSVVATDNGFVVAGITESTDGDVQGKQTNLPSTWIVKLEDPNKTLLLTQPTYNCSTGAITFNTTGGDGSTITYTAPGIARSSVTSNTGTIEQGLRNDPKTIAITAMQSGQSTTYSFDLSKACRADSAPILTQPIRNKVVPVNQSLAIESTGIVNTDASTGAGYFIDPLAYYPNGAPVYPYVSLLYLTVSGLPAGLTAKTFSYYDYIDPPTNSLRARRAYAYLTGTPTKVGVYTVLVTASVNGKSTSTTFTITVTDSNQPPTPTPTGDTLTLTQPTYDCSTGAITFNTTGGDGSTITYTAPGITRSAVTSNSGVVEQGLRNDPKTVTITATQNGQTATYSFDLKAACNGTSPTTPPTPTTSTTLTLTAPTYDCSTGAFTFNYTGGDGSPVEFQAIGITGWTTNPSQFVDRESRTASDVKPFTLMARQNGQVITYTWDLKATCGRSARMAATEAEQTLELTVKGNPVGNTVVVEIRGAEGRPLQLDLLNASGHVLEQRHIEQAGAVDEQRFDLQRQPTGLLFLRAQNGPQKQTVKLIKQ